MRSTVNAQPGGSWFGWRTTSLFGPAVEALRRRRWQRLWLGPAVAVLVAAAAMGFRTRPGHAFIGAYAITHPGDTLATTMLRIPLSMFAPAALLPFWFALVQVTIVYSLAQSLVGTRQTIIVALCGHALATLSAHLWILLGRPIGVSHDFNRFPDPGPSAAVVALIAYIAIVRRVGWLVIVVLAYDAIEVGIFNGLSQREHMVGTLTGIVAGVLATVLRWRGSVPGPRPG